MPLFSILSLILWISFVIALKLKLSIDFSNQSAFPISSIVTISLLFLNNNLNTLSSDFVKGIISLFIEIVRGESFIIILLGKPSFS